MSAGKLLGMTSLYQLTISSTLSYYYKDLPIEVIACKPDGSLKITGNISEGKEEITIHSLSFEKILEEAKKEKEGDVFILEYNSKRIFYKNNLDALKKSINPDLLEWFQNAIQITEWDMKMFE